MEEVLIALLVLLVLAFIAIMYLISNYKKYDQLPILEVEVTVRDKSEIQHLYSYEATFPFSIYFVNLTLNNESSIIVETDNQTYSLIEKGSRGKAQIKGDTLVGFERI